MTTDPSPADPPPYSVREMRPGEERVLAELYVKSVREIGVQAYSAEQVAEWSSFGQHFVEFQARLQSGTVLVAEGEQGGVLGFGQLEQDNHLALLYTAPHVARKGVATAIYRGLEAIALRQGMGNIRTEASHLSRPFFSKQGFRVLAPETVERNGIAFERFRMEKAIG